VPFVLLWSNLGQVALPFSIALTVAAVLALPLRRAAERSGLPRGRERCVGCVAEPGLLRQGYCVERCAVNRGPGLPMVLFVATATLALFALFDPAGFARAVLPFDLTGPGIAATVAAMLIGANAGAALLLAAFFLQDLPVHRKLFLEGSLAAALFGLILPTVGPGSAMGRTDLLTPLALGAVLLVGAVEVRARVGRPAFGWRAVGLAIAPLILVGAFAAVRLVEFVQLGTG
jgi:hypothetical protein